MELRSLLKKAGMTLGGLLLAGNLGCNSSFYPQTAINMEQRAIDLEEKVSKPKRGIVFNYNTESEEKGADYSTSRAVFSQDSGILDYYPNILELSSAEQSQIEDIINDIKFKNSYQSFVESAENLSENQKLVLLGTIGGLLGRFNYDYSYPEYEVASQVVFFNKLQDSLESGSHNNLGVCRHIHSHIEQLANDLGIEAAAVTGVNGEGIYHVYSIIKTDDGSAVIDYYDILTTNTNNIEKVLEAYQKWRGTTVFEHLFFEDAEFKYKLITRDGRHFLDFIGYDKSLGSLRDALTRDVNNTETMISIDWGDYLDSLEFNYQGFFIKAGNISGSSFSPMERMELLQTGYKGKFSILDVINVDGNMSLIYGRLNQDKELDVNEALGVAGSFIASTDNENAFNLGLKVAGDIFLMGGNPLAYDLTAGIGTSYKFATEKLGVKPYVAVQYSLFPQDIGTWKLGLMFNELCVGSRFDINDLNLSVEPYYIKRMWEEGPGANISFGNENFKLNLGGYATRSNYEFCPHKSGFDVGLCATFKNLEIGVGYKREKVDYSGEKEDQELLNFRVCTKF